MQTFVASVVIFGLLIFVHELGHFLVAKKAGIGVTEFAIGFGPRLLGWQAGETSYSLRLFPLGGFVRLVGQDPEESELEGSFQRQPIWRRFAVIISGPLMNLALAVVIFSLIYFAFVGIPNYQSTAVGGLLPGGRAMDVGLQPGDMLQNVAGEQVNDWPEVVKQINANPEKQITIDFERDGRRQTVQVTPRRDPQTGLGLIGISPQTRLYAFFPSLQMGFSNTVRFLEFIGVSILQMLTGRIAPDVVGPVGIVQIVGEAARTGVVNLLSLAAIISVNLGLLNLLPIPALDGSKLLFLLLEAVRGRPVDPRKESFIHFVGFTVLILLMIVVAYRDLVRLDIFF